MIRAGQDDIFPSEGISGVWSRRLSHPRVNDLPVEPSQEEALVTMTMDFSLLKIVFPPEQRPIWSVTMPPCYLVSMPKKVSSGEI